MRVSRASRHAAEIGIAIAVALQTGCSTPPAPDVADTNSDATMPSDIGSDVRSDTPSMDSDTDSSTIDSSTIDSSTGDSSTDDASSTDASADANSGEASADAETDTFVEDIPCPGVETQCSGMCVDTNSSVAHCGACGNACPTGQSCVFGVCELPCSAPSTLCGTGAAMVCTNLQSDRANCGMCGRACAATEFCNAGSCASDACSGVVCTPSDACHQANACDRSVARCASMTYSATVDNTARSMLVGTPECAVATPSSGCYRQRYTNALNVASVSNGARPAVTSGVLPGTAPIHQPQNINDGFYGNGASWVASSANGWVKIDLGREIALDRITLGRDRLNTFGERPMGRYTIALATMDAVYAEGDSANDAMEYRTVFDSAQRGGVGETIPQGQTITVSFPPVLARFIKVSVTTDGAAIDEIEAFGCDPAMRSCPALPNTSTAQCNDGLANTFGSVCDRGLCAGGTVCPAGRNDCDGSSANACESDPLSDDMNCGACGNVCPAASPCVSGRCRPSLVATPLASPVLIPNSAGCTIEDDTYSEQVKVARDGSIWVLMRCATTSRVSRSIDGGRTYSTAVDISVAPFTRAAIAARSRDEALVISSVITSFDLSARIVSTRTTNGGATWSASMPPIVIRASNSQAAMSMTFEQNAYYALWTVGPSATPRVYRTLDGVSWAAIASLGVATVVSVNDISSIGDGRLGVVTSTEGYAYSASSPFSTYTRAPTRLLPNNSIDGAIGGPTAVAARLDMSSHLLIRGTLPSGAMISSTVPGFGPRSLDADWSGNVAFASNSGVPNRINISMWPRSAAAPNALIGWTLSGSPASAALGAVPYQFAAVVAAHNAVGVHMINVVP